MDQNTTQVDNYYVVPLPLKSKNVSLPNNRITAVKRLNCLQIRFLKDENFYGLYKAFIDDMLTKGYAKKNF